MSLFFLVTIVGHLVDQYNVTWKTKRPTFHMKSHVNLKGHGSQTVMREVEQSQGLVSPLAVNTILFEHAQDFFTLTPPT